MVGAQSSESDREDFESSARDQLSDPGQVILPLEASIFVLVEQGSPYLLPKGFTKIKWDSPNKMLSRAPGREKMVIP